MPLPLPTPVSRTLAPLSDAAKAAIEASGLDAIADKLYAGQRLTESDAIELYDCPSIVAIGTLADAVRTQMHGDVSWFNRNQHINATNVCEASCIFCSFARLETGMAEAYTMTFEEALGRLHALRKQFITEVHIVNGLNPDLPFDYYPGLLSALKRERPDLHIKGFTAVEIHYYAEKYDMSVEAVLSHLRKAGMDSMPGGGAEIFADRARKKLCHDKVNSDQWLDIHETAHTMGFRTNATMLFGSIETLEERVDHMARLRDLQDRTGGFQTFIPLKFHNENNRLQNVAETTGLDCWKTLAIGRLFLDNFAHIKAYWPMMGVQVAQLSQAFGVSDIDGTVREERIYHMAGATTPQGLSRTELLSMIDRAGRLGLERDTLYQIVAETPALVETDGAAPPARIAGVGYLNAWPLRAKLDRTHHDVTEAVPDAVADLLHAGEADVALVPVAAIMDGGDWRIVPGMAIGADGPVESVLLVSETPPEQWTGVLLDGESRTSAVLAQLLLAEGPLSKRVGPLEITRVGRGEAVARASGTVAAMVIGDAARELPERMVHHFDLAGLWKEWTGLPFVFAVWAGRPSLDPRLGADLRRAAAEGRAAIETEFEGADRSYLSTSLRYDLDDLALMGLRRFAALGKRHGHFEGSEVRLLDPQHKTRSGPSLTQLLAEAAAVQHARRKTVRWGLVGDAAPAVRQWVRNPDLLATASRAEVFAPLAAIAQHSTDWAALKAAGLTGITLDDGGPLLTDPVRQSRVDGALAAGLVVEGACLYGRGETQADRDAHLLELHARDIRSIVVRFAGWRGPNSDGSGTAADWLRVAARLRLNTDRTLICPWQTEGLAVLQVALQTCADQPEPLTLTPAWEAKAWKLDRAIRDAGLEVERLGMDTPAAPRGRIQRRPRIQPPRPTA